LDLVVRSPAFECKGGILDKREELLKLVKKRRRRDIFTGYGRLADYGNGAFDCDFVSPYSKGAHNYDASVMILLQDWSSDDALRRSSGPSELGRDPDLPTNKTLDALLGASLHLTLKETYATNLFPFIKAGGLSTRIPFADLVLAATEFAFPQIKIVAPRLVVCLGKNTFNALRVAAVQGGLAHGLTRCRDMDSAIREAFAVELEGRKVAIWAQAHTGAWGQRNRNKNAAGRASEDWMKMSRAVGSNIRG
jgi:uracil-DNA glycosylase